jgi:hypothetical protein
LEALVPDIREKIQDTKDMKQQNLENKEEEETTGFPKGEVSLLWLFPIPVSSLKIIMKGFLRVFANFSREGYLQ